MTLTDRSHGAQAAMAAVTAVGSARVLRLLTGWRAGLREFAVILASVLAALLAQAWWQDHEERGREAGYLRQLLADVRTNQNSVTDAIVFDSTGAALGRQAMRVLIGVAAAPPADTFGQWVGHAASSRDFRPQYGTYRAIVGTGDLRLIRNDTLRAMITQYFARVESEEQTLNELRRLSVEQILPLGRAFPFFRQGYADRTQVRVDFPRLRADPEVANLMFGIQVANANRLAALRSIRHGTITLRRALEAETGAANAEPARATPGAQRKAAR